MPLLLVAYYTAVRAPTYVNRAPRTQRECDVGEGPHGGASRAGRVDQGAVRHQRRATPYDSPRTSAATSAAWHTPEPA